MRFLAFLVALFLAILYGGKLLIDYAQRRASPLPVGFGGRAP